MVAVVLEALARETGGELIGESVALGKLVMDSRQVGKGDLFAAVKGGQVDGHSFAPNALRAGAAALLTERRLDGLAPQLVVGDVTLASGRFGYLKRCAFGGAVVAITGSAGKTTTKNLLSAALAPAGAVHATAGNQNNELGVPITLSRLSSEHRFAVIEMGAGRPGDIAYLCEMARPDVAVCLNASAAHLANYDSVAAIAATKGEIFEGLGSAGLAVLNADSEWLPQWRQQAHDARQVTFGLADGADYRAVALERDGVQGTRFMFRGPMGELPVVLRLAGDQHVSNALASLAVAIELGVDPVAAADAVATVTPGAGRGLVALRPEAGRVVDDSYNANPAAVKAAIDVLAREPGYRVLVLGSMLELGETTEILHREIGAYAAQSGIDQIITVGVEAAPAAEAFGPVALCFQDQAALQAAFPSLPPDHVIWVKGSRGMGLEHTVAWLLSSEEALPC